MEDRRASLMAHVGPGKRRGIEYGPLARPVVVADEDRSVVYLDHLDTEGLRRKHSDHPLVDIDEIVPVDHVLDGRPLLDIVGDGFDFVVASHVLEHVPDPITWFAEAGAVLRPGGVIALALPDMRTGFDVARPLTTPADLLAAHIEQRCAPSVAQVLEHHMYALRNGEAISWAEPVPRSQLLAVHDHRFAMDQAACAAADEYVDVHCWVFTPDSFAANVTMLRALERLDFELMEPPVIGVSEFFVHLRLRPDDVAAVPEEWEQDFRTSGVLHDARGNDDAAEQLAALYRSTSWRVTAPLRRLSDARRRFSP